VRAGWPDKEIHLFGAGTDSGTYDYFAEAIVGKDKGTRGDYQASEDDNVLVQGIAGDPLALGFFGLAYYEENKDKLKLLGVDDGNPDNGEGCVKPTLETVEKGTYQPLSRPLFIYVKKTAAETLIVEAFVDPIWSRLPPCPKSAHPFP
jgi:phosphate transport system substrate-binding protein